MTQQTIDPYGTKEVTVPYGEKIAISTTGGGIVTIYYQVLAPGPIKYYVHDRISNEEVLLGTFSADQGVKIETKGSPALYNVGSSPTVGVGDADTLSGLAATQFLRSDAADTAEQNITFASSPTLNNNKFLNANESGGTARAIAGIDGSNETQIGNANNKTYINSNGTTEVPSANLLLSNNQKLQIEDTGGTAQNVAHITNSDVVQLGNAAYPTNIRSDGTLQYNGATLASGTIDTTATQTITVVDGLITAIA